MDIWWKPTLISGYHQLGCVAWSTQSIIRSINYQNTKQCISSSENLLSCTLSRSRCGGDAVLLWRGLNLSDRLKQLAVTKSYVPEWRQHNCSKREQPLHDSDLQFNNREAGEPNRHVTLSPLSWPSLFAWRCVGVTFFLFFSLPVRRKARSIRRSVGDWGERPKSGSWGHPSQPPPIPSLESDRDSEPNKFFTLSLFLLRVTQEKYGVLRIKTKHCISWA